VAFTNRQPLTIGNTVDTENEALYFPLPEINDILSDDTLIGERL
jgi:hypothetical protein